MRHLSRFQLFTGLAICYVFAIMLNSRVLAQTEITVRPIDGIAGVSTRWGAGWLDLDEAFNFKKNDRLRLQIGGTANRVIVRLLAKNHFPDEPTGIIGHMYDVPDSRIVELLLEEDHKGILQISVHGGPSAWYYNLGRNNGPATLLRAELIRP